MSDYSTAVVDRAAGETVLRAIRRAVFNRLPGAAGARAKSFYAGRGFAESGAVFMEAGLEHAVMTRALR